MDRRNNLNVTVGKRIHKARERAGIPQEQLAEMIGIGEKSLSAVERGVSGISVNPLCNVCERLSARWGCKTDYLHSCEFLARLKTPRTSSSMKARNRVL